MPKFRKRPIVVEAIQFDATSENLAELSSFMNRRVLFNANREELTIETLEGDHTALSTDQRRRRSGSAAFRIQR